MPTDTFEYSGDPVTLVANTPLPDSEQSLDIPMFAGFDPESAAKHFRFKFHATQAVTGALNYFKVEFFNSEMEASDDWSGVLIMIQNGWIGAAGESWGSGPEPENRTTFVSDHDHYGTTEGAFTPPDYLEVYEAQDGGSFWADSVIATVGKTNHLPAGGDWFLRITLGSDSPGDVTLHDFSFELTYQGYRARNVVGPIPLTEGWVCSNPFPLPTELYLIIHHGVAFMYGQMLDWFNWNDEEDAPWFTNVYDDATTMLVDVGGVPEQARPESDTVVPISFYDFDRKATVLGERWELSINTDGSITFVERVGRLPDKLRLGGGDYGFTPMQVRWPIADQTHGPDTGPETDVIWEVHNELVNEGEVGGETWEWVHPIEITKHGGIAHLRGAVSKEGDYGAPLWGSTVEGFGEVKILDEEASGRDFPYIQQFGSEIAVEAPGSVEVQFDASPSSGNDPLTYDWDFGDGDTGTGITPVHTYASPGTYSVTLTVTDERGHTDSVTKDVGAVNMMLPNPWATFVSAHSATINSPGFHVHFMSADPDTQVFKGGDMVSGVIPNAPGSHFIGADDIDAYFTANKHLIGSGIRTVDVDMSSPEMPYTTASVVGRKYGTAVCIQPDGSHYRHEVECIAVPGGAHPNTYRHKLYKNVGGTDTQIGGGSVDTNDPICIVYGQISFLDVEMVRWTTDRTVGSSSVNNSEVPKSGKWGFFVSSGVTLDHVEVVDNEHPLLPADGEVVTFEYWWPVEYEFDESSP